VLGKWINFDIGLFYLNYNNRIGIVSDNGIPFRTNIGTSESMGIESYIEFDLTKLITEKSRWGSLSLFASNAFIEAYYSRWDNPAIAEDPTKSIKNKKVENAPSFIHRFGTTYNIKKLTLVIQYNYISEVYTDAANTVTPNASATIGKLPAYQVIDATLTYNLLEKYIIKAGVNNLNNEKYATRRSGGYPGPGILPGNGRTYFVTFGAKF
jgi:Fe(3+) dicitrate transport protein